MLVVDEFAATSYSNIIFFFFNIKHRMKAVALYVPTVSVCLF